MKIRAGFVTNSSSTAYTIIVDAEYFNEVIKTVHPYVAAVAKALITADKFMGNDVITMGYFCDMDGSSTLDDLEVDYEFTDEEQEKHDDYDDDFSVSGAFDKLEQLLAKTDPTKFLHIDTGAW